MNRLQPWKVSAITYSYHIVDYSMGFCSKFLPGAVFYGIFGEKGTPQVATVCETVLLLLFFAALVFLVERFVLRAEQDLRTGALITALFFLCGPFTFAIYSYELGMLDVYWLFLAAAFFLSAANRYLKFLIPLLFLLAVLVHYSAVLCVIVLFSILLLYRASDDDAQKRSFLLIFWISVVLSAGLVVYFIAFEKSNLRYSMEEFDRIIKERNGVYTTYYEYALYSYYNKHAFVPEGVMENTGSAVMRLLLSFYYQVRVILVEQTEPKDVYKLIGNVLFAAPALVLFYKEFILLFKNNGQNRLKRLCAFFMCAQFPFTLIFGCLMSADINRWISHAFLISATLLFCVLYREKENRAHFLGEILAIKNAYPFRLYALAYFMSTFWAYC